MGYEHRRTFCCCIPTRLGVLILSSLTLLASAVNAWASLSPILSDSNGPNDWLSNYKNLSSSSRAILIINGSVAIASGLCALAGLIGAIIRQRRLVGLYSFAVWILLLASVALGSLSIWSAYKNKAQVVSNCAQQITVGQNREGGQQWKEQMCSDAYRVGLIVTCVVFAVVCLIQTYLCVIVGRYKHQLDAEHVARTPVGVPSRSQYQYVHDVEKHGV
ncbi:hypothetical protein CF319_g5489 [Tilletia indica]|nr:hypothetical protein CF319_g5489 [Tilletia indica]